MTWWRDIVSGIFVCIMALIALGLFLLTVVSIVDAAGQPITGGEYLGVLFDYVTFSPVPAKLVPVIGALSQPLILGASVLALAYPFYAAVRDATERKTAIVETEKSKQDKNRERTSEVLAHEFETASSICIVSGDYSWLAESAGAKKALFAILKRHDAGADHVRAISYKTRQEIVQGLKVQAQTKGFSDITDEVISKFASLAIIKPHLIGIKMTIADHLGERRLYMVASAEHGEAEQLVKIKDNEYGRQLINIFDGLFKVAVDAPSA